ncbi:MAG: transaldolase family protein [Planctomycetota bacterium]
MFRTILDSVVLYPCDAVSAERLVDELECWGHDVIDLGTHDPKPADFPDLAYDTSGTIDEARRLWKSVDRPNLMVKVPATKEGIPAAESLLAEGININITLMFSIHHYEAVAQAYRRAPEKVEDPRHMSSVASFFVSNRSRFVGDGEVTCHASRVERAIAIARAHKQEPLMNADEH